MLRKLWLVAFSATLMLGGSAWAGDWDVDGTTGGGSNVTVAIDGSTISATNSGASIVQAGTTSGDSATLTINGGVDAINAGSLTINSSASDVASFTSGATGSFTNSDTLTFVGDATNKAVMNITVAVTNTGTITFDENTTVTAIGGTDGLTNEGGTINLAADAQTGTVITAIGNAANKTAGTLNINYDITSAIGGGGLTGGIVNIQDQTTALSSINIEVGAATLNVGDIKTDGEIDAAALNVASGKTLTNTGTDLTLADTVLGGEGSIANTGTLTVDGTTTIADGSSIEITNTGTISTNAAGLGNVSANIKADVPSTGFGTITVSDSLVDNNVSLAGATGGTLTLTGAQVVNGTVDVGAGTVAFASTAEINGTVNAAVTQIAGATSIGATGALNSGLKYGGAVTLTAEEGAVVDFTGKTIDFNSAAGVINNAGTMTIGADTVLDNVSGITPGSALLNSGTLTVTGEALGVLGLGADAGKLGTVNVTTELDGNLTVTGAPTEGTVNLQAEQGTAVDVHVAGADLTITGGEFGTVTANDITIKGDTIFNQKLNATGDVDATGVRVTYAGGLDSDSLVIGKDTETGIGGTASVIKELIINNGGILYTAGATTITGDGNKGFTLNKGGELDVSGGSLTLDQYKNVSLNGIVVLGEDTLNTITVTNAEKASLGKDVRLIIAKDAALDLAEGQYEEADYVTVMTTNITDPENIGFNGPITESTIWGQFTFDGVADPAGAQLAITGVEGNKFSRSNWEDAQETVIENLHKANAGSSALIDGGLARAVYGEVAATTNSEKVLDNNSWINEADLTAEQIAERRDIAEYNHELLEDVAYGLVSHGKLKATLGGEINESLLGTMSTVRNATNMINTRQSTLVAQIDAAASSDFANASYLLNGSAANRIWAGYIGSWEDADRKDGIEGYKYDQNGFIIGYDRLIGSNLAAGATFSYSKGDFEDKAANWNDSEVENYSLQGYLTYSACNGFFANLFGGYTWSDNEIRARYGSDSFSADYDSNTWNIGANLGYSFKWLDRLVVTPTVGLTYIDAEADSHGRYVNGMYTSHASKASTNALLLPVDINARYDFEFSNCSRLSVEGNVGYAYNFKRDSALANITLNGVSYGGAADGAVVLRGKGRDQSRHTWNFGAGLRYYYNQFDIGVKYDYYLQSDADAHRIMGTVGLSF